MIIRDYVFTDYLIMERQPEQEWLPSSWGMDDVQYAKLISTLHDPKTVIIDDQIVLIGSIGMNSGWAGEGGFIVCKDFRKVFVKHGKTIIEALKNYLDKSPFSMVYSCIDPKIPGAIKLANLLGFEFYKDVRNPIEMKLFIRIN